MNRVLALTAIACFAVAAAAQEVITSFVEADGTATIYAPPTHVDFVVVFHAAPQAASTEKDAAPAPTAPSNTAAVDQLIETANGFRKSVNDLDLHPVEFEVSTPTVRNAVTVEVSCAARMRFSLSGFANPDTGPRQFAELCDKLATLSQSANSELQGPLFDIEDKESVQRNAVTQATTNAYPIGDAIALSLSSRIDYVDSVKVLEIAFETNPTEPNLKQIACTAKVHVTYAVHAAQP